MEPDGSINPKLNGKAGGVPERFLHRIGLDRPVPLSLTITVVVLVLILVIVAIAGLLSRDRRPLRDEVRSVATMALNSAHSSWGFNFVPALIPLDEIINVAPPKEGVHALTEPDYLPSVAAESTKIRLQKDNLVAGLVVEGEARAYPFSLLLVHECVNDVLGGEPVAVTYHPLSDSLMAFSRRIGGDVHEFGLSGLIYQSNGLLYDRRPDPHDESLWSQIQMRAVTGPATRRNARLDSVDVEFTTWGQWLDDHPATSLVTFNNGYDATYSDNMYERYFDSEDLYYEVTGRTERRPDLRDKERVLVVTAGERMRAYPYTDIENASGGSIEESLAGWSLTVARDASNDRLIKFNAIPESQSGYSTDDPLELRRFHCYWFAWDVTYPDGEVYRPR